MSALLLPGWIWTCAGMALLTALLLLVHHWPAIRSLRPVAAILLGVAVLDDLSAGRAPGVLTRGF